MLQCGLARISDTWSSRPGPGGPQERLSPVTREGLTLLTLQTDTYLPAVLICAQENRSI